MHIKKIQNYIFISGALGENRKAKYYFRQTYISVTIPAHRKSPQPVTDFDGSFLSILTFRGHNFLHKSIWKVLK